MGKMFHPRNQCPSERSPASDTLCQSEKILKSIIFKDMLRTDILKILPQLRRLHLAVESRTDLSKSSSGSEKQREQLCDPEESSCGVKT